jgi:hypothetical protein
MSILSDHWPALLVAVGGIIAVVGSSALTVRQSREQAIQAIQRAQYEQQLREHTEQLLAKTETISGLNRELATKSDEISRLSVRGLKTLTGGDSLSILHVGNRKDPAGPLLTVLHRGDFPLYDLVVGITDIERRETAVETLRKQNRPVAFEEMFTPHYRFTIGTLAPGTSATLRGRLPALKGDQQMFEVQFSARNGLWKQFIAFRFVDGEWKMYTDVYREPRQPHFKSLYKAEDKGYPSASPNPQ